MRDTVGFRCNQPRAGQCGVVKHLPTISSFHVSTKQILQAGFESSPDNLFRNVMPSPMYSRPPLVRPRGPRSARPEKSGVRGSHRLAVAVTSEHGLAQL